MALAKIWLAWTLTHAVWALQVGDTPSSPVISSLVDRAMQQQMQQLKLGDVPIAQQAHPLQKTTQYVLHVQQAHTLEMRQPHAQLQYAQQDRAMQQQVKQLSWGMCRLCSRHMGCRKLSRMLGFSMPSRTGQCINCTNTCRCRMCRLCSRHSFCRKRRNMY